MQSIFQEIFCSFGIHDWVENKIRAGDWRFKWFKCKHCPAERCEDK